MSFVGNGEKRTNSDIYPNDIQQFKCISKLYYLAIKAQVSKTLKNDSSNYIWPTRDTTNFISGDSSTKLQCS